MSYRPDPVDSDCHDAGCECARCRAMRGSQRGLERARRIVCEWAKRCFEREDGTRDHPTEIALWRAVRDLREREEAERLAKARRRAGQLDRSLVPDPKPIAEGEGGVK